MSKQIHIHTLHAARLAIIVAGGCAAAFAREAHTNLAVGATVRAVAHLDIADAPTMLQISAADLERGFIDVSQATQFTVRSNSATGFALDVMTVVPLLQSMQIRGLDSELVLGGDGGTVVQRWQQGQARTLALKYRFVLAPHLLAGDYPWPVRLAVRPLESI